MLAVQPPSGQGMQEEANLREGLEVPGGSCQESRGEEVPGEKLMSRNTSSLPHASLAAVS